MKKIFSWTLVGLWMGMIFWFSHQPASASSQMSSGLTMRVLAFIERYLPFLKIDVDTLHHLVRKNAHFMIYLILGLLASNAMFQSGIRGVKSFMLAWGICILYAMSDEFHQLFVVGRSGEFRDVVIDSSGSLLGSLGYFGWRHLFRVLSRS